MRENRKEKNRDALFKGELMLLKDFVQWTGGRERRERRGRGVGSGEREREGEREGEGGEEGEK